MTDSWRPVHSSPLQAVAIFNYNVAGIQNGTKDEPVSQLIYKNTVPVITKLYFSSNN